MKFVLPLLLISSLIGLGACSDDSPAYIDNLNFDNKPEADIAFNQSTVDCENQSDCPGYIGGLIMYTETQESDWLYGSYTSYNVGFCSGQLIAPDRVLTNRHCIPDVIASTGGNCMGNIAVKFPATTQFPAETVHCKTILEYSELHAQANGNPRVPDWAVIQLERPVNRETPQLDKKGFPEGTEFNAWPSYYTQSTGYKGDKSAPIANGIIKKITCKTVMNNALIFYYRHASSPLFVGNCDYQVIGGNSGSGVYKNGKLAGVLSFAFNKELGEIKRGFLRASVENKIGGGTNIQCIPYYNETLPEMCYWEPSQTTAMALGTDFYMINGATANELEQMKMESFVGNDETVQWVATELKWFTSAIEEANIFNQYNQGKMFSKLYSQTFFTKKYPVMPGCIKAVMKDEDEFTVKFPFYRNRLDKSSLNNRAQFEMPLEVAHHSYTFSFDEAKQVFVGKIDRIESLSDVTSYKTKRDSMRSDVSKCFYSEDPSSIFYTCQNAKSKYEVMVTLKVNDANDGAIYENEELIEKFPSLSEIEVGVCEE